MAVKIKGTTVIYDDEVSKVGANTEANRPDQPIQGMIRFNTDAVTFEGYDGATWGPIGGNIDIVRGVAYNSHIIGDSANTTFNINHLLNDSNVIINVIESDTGYKVQPDVIFNDANNITVIFADPPSSDQYEVLVFSTDFDAIVEYIQSL